MNIVIKALQLCLRIGIEFLDLKPDTDWGISVILYKIGVFCSLLIRPLINIVYYLLHPFADRYF